MKSDFGSEEMAEAVSQLKKDLKEFGESCTGILLFGSYAEGKPTKRSDIDICIVKPIGGKEGEKVCAQIR